MDFDLSEEQEAVRALAAQIRRDCEGARECFRSLDG